MEYAAFIADFPSFEQVPVPQVMSALRQAASRMDPKFFGGQYDAAHGFLTAHILSINPKGSTTRFTWDTQKTIHLREYEHIRRSCGITISVV